MSIATALEQRGYIADIGQITPDDKRWLHGEIRAGRVTKCRAPWAGCMLPKTHYVADEARFSAAQAESAELLGRCIRVDEAVREGRITPTWREVGAAGWDEHVRELEAGLA